MTEQSRQKVSISQIKAARALLGWSQEALAEAAEVSIPTIKRLEAVDGPLGGRQQTAARILAALARAGITFIDDDARGAGVYLARKRRGR